MDTTRVALLQEVLAGTEWIGRTRAFARTLRTSTREPGGLLLVGTPAEEPWHLAAHLGDEARLSGVPSLAPTLVRWSPPPDAFPHLSPALQGRIKPPATSYPHQTTHHQRYTACALGDPMAA